MNMKNEIDTKEKFIKQFGKSWYELLILVKNFEVLNYHKRLHPGNFIEKYFSTFNLFFEFKSKKNKFGLEIKFIKVIYDNDKGTSFTIFESEINEKLINSLQVNIFGIDKVPKL